LQPTDWGLKHVKDTDVASVELTIKFFKKNRRGKGGGEGDAVGTVLLEGKGVRGVRGDEN